MSRGPHVGAFRFHPPRLERSSGLANALRLAFGPLEKTAPGALLSEDLTVRWIGRLDLATRIGYRLRSGDGMGPDRGDELSGKLGGGVAEALIETSKLAAARGLALEELAKRAAHAAEQCGAEALALKGVALGLGGWSPLGSRSSGDVDLLVPRAAAREISSTLEGCGMRAASLAATDHHLPVLSHPRLGAIELHVFLPGLVMPSSRAPCSMEALGESADETPFGALPAPGLRLPARRLLGAHLVTHALDQHAASPGVYPLMRVVGDLLDLCGRCVGSGSDAASSFESQLRSLFADLSPWMSTSVSPRESTALEELSLELARGHLPTPGSDAERLLAHFTRGVSSSLYRGWLKIERLPRRLRALGWRGRTQRT